MNQEPVARDSKPPISLPGLIAGCLMVFASSTTAFISQSIIGGNRLVYLPLMMPSLVAIGTYSLLLAWNEYLYAFLLLSNDRDVTLGVALGNFLAADDSPWELLMTTGLIYALPPAAIYYTFKRYMVGGLTAGAVKS